GGRRGLAGGWDLFTALCGDADLHALLIGLHLDACAFACARINEHHVRCMKWLLALEDAALLHAWGWLHVALHEVHALDDHAVLFGEETHDLALLAFVFAGDDDHLIALLQSLNAHHSTSGASEMIFMNFLPRSSRATGPKMRVPIGSSCGLMRTAL